MRNVLIALVVCVATCAYGQGIGTFENGPPSEFSLKQSHPDDYLSPAESFDITSDHLDRDFKGHNIQKIGEFLVQNRHLINLPRKGEFETTDDYNERVKEHNPQDLLFGAAHEKHYYAFYIDPSAAALSKLEYDADRKKLLVHVNIKDFALERKTVENSRTLSATTAFGGTVDVEYTDKVEHVVSLYHPQEIKRRGAMMCPIQPLRRNGSFTTPIQERIRKAA